MKSRRSKIWTEAECNILREYYYTMSRKALFELLPDKSLNDIVEQIHIMKRKNIEFVGE